MSTASGKKCSGSTAATIDSFFSKGADRTTSKKNSNFNKENVNMGLASNFCGSGVQSNKRRGQVKALKQKDRRHWMGHFLKDELTKAMMFARHAKG